MSLLKEWREYAYNFDDRTPEGKQFWLNYFGVEKGIYQLLLAKPNAVIKGTVKELAEKYDTSVQLMTGFLDGINESIKTPNPIEEMEEDTEITIEIDIEKLYMNMVKYNADWLYTMEEWDKLLSEEERKELYKKQKSSTTVIKPPKVGRNDPCPCGSGKKYKQCCGK